MSRIIMLSDLHLGHKNILKFREGFSSQEDHDNTLFENLATEVGKRDSVIFGGDVAFDKFWLDKIASIKCVKKTLILGNHDLERGITMEMLMNTYDKVESLYSKRNIYFTHCPIHPQQFRGHLLNIHGHMHNEVVTIDVDGETIPDKRYVNICVEHTNFKPITFAEAMERGLF